MSRVLWITNLPVGEGPALLGLRPSVFGGWLRGLLDEVSLNADLAMSVAFPVKDGASSVTGNQAEYYTFPTGPSGRLPNTRTIRRLEHILEFSQPDLVHVFGTELQHCLAALQLCRERGIPALLQLQGLMGSIAQHYNGWLPHEVTRRSTLAERLRGRTLQQQQRTFERAGAIEAKAIALAENVLGRTTYDKAWVNSNNPAADYHHIDETLRNSFYDADWRLSDHNRNSIFLSQATATYKGAHIAIAAMPSILDSFPRAQLLIAGPSPLGAKRLGDAARRTTYSKHLRSLIKNLGLGDHVHFVGSLHEEEMRESYLKSHVVVSCSSIENSSNSVCEAQLLGIPVVASYVGGVPDLVSHGKTGYLYQGDAPYMLAHYVKTIFEDDALARRLGREARIAGLRRHEQRRNLQALLEIYSGVMSRKLQGDP